MTREASDGDAMTREEFVAKWLYYGGFQDDEEGHSNIKAEMTADLTALLAAERRRVREADAKVSTEYVGKILTLYQGKLPFVFFKSVEQSDADREASMAQYVAERIAAAIRAQEG